MNHSVFPWACPVCSLPLSASESTWRCSYGHCYDPAKSGYVNLLLANQKSSQQPGDDKAMLLARKAFLETGLFDPLVVEVANTINSLSPTEHQPRQLLDCGCGEGYYPNKILGLLKGQWQIGGLDIAKAAVNLAAKYTSDISWVCASSAHLPVQSQSLDVLLRVFAPAPHEEVSRVLKPSGYYIVVGPGEQHLMEIKQALYETVTPYAKPGDIPGFSLISSQSVEESLLLEGNEVITQLMTMTPFFWRGNSQKRSEILAASQMTVQLHGVISVYQKSP